MLPNFLIYGLFALTILVSFFGIMIYSLNMSQVSIPSFIAKAHFAVPPLVALSLGLLIQSTPERGRFFKTLLFLLVMVFLGGLVFVGESKVVMFILVAILLYAFRLVDFSFPRCFWRVWQDCY